MKRFSIKSFVFDMLIITLGCALYAGGITVFVEPNPIAPGGATGIAMIVHDFWKFIPIGVTIIFINIPLIIMGFIYFRMDFVIKTTYSIIVSSVMIDLFVTYLPFYQGDTILSALAGGVISGAGLASIMMRGATTGGTDIVAKLVNRKFRYLSVGRLMLLVDALIVILSAVVHKSFETVLYSILFLFTLSVIMDKLLYGADHGKMVYIVTDNPKPLLDGIFSVVGRGATNIKVQGGYTNSEHYMIMCAARPTEVSKILSVIKSTDKNAFVVVSDVGEIVGQGFKNFESN